LGSSSQLLFAVFDRNGVPLSFVAGPVPVFTRALGDRTGLRVASVLYPLADLDLDGALDAPELTLGRNPLDATSTPPSLTLSGTPAAGQSFSINLSIPAEAGFPYVTGASLGTSGIPVARPDCLSVPLSPDLLFFYWLGPSNAVTTTPVSFTLDILGTGGVTVSLPPGPGFGGVGIYFSAVTVSPAALGVSSIATALQVVLP
jgi:hypothetical protein